jgi:tRNA(adenine34) deaminase
MSAQYDAAMRQALELARTAMASGEVPVGAIIVDELGTVIATGANTRERDHDPLGHAEVNAIREATRLRGDWRLEGCTLIVTLEPCVMCAGAIVAARIPKIVFGAWDEKAGASGSVHDLLRDRRLNHQVEVHAGVLEEECGQLMTSFFREKFD